MIGAAACIGGVIYVVQAGYWPEFGTQ